MFTVKPMSEGDFGFATKLANTMNWNMAKEDFQFMKFLDPDGCFIAFYGRERVGIATSIGFGEVGWFGNLIVEEKYRKRGVGSLLTKHSIAYLQSKGVQSIGLFAESSLHSFYGKLDFKIDEDFWVLHAEDLNQLGSEDVPTAGKEQISVIEKFDSQYFKGDRRQLLESIILEEGNFSYFKSHEGMVDGYVAATVIGKMAWVGPLICQERKVDVANSLLRAVLFNLVGKNVYTVLPKKEVAVADMLFGAGFKEDFSVSRMFLGEAVAKNCIYLAESLERG